jgi:hypothetical protein
VPEIGEPGRQRDVGADTAEPRTARRSLLLPALAGSMPADNTFRFGMSYKFGGG